MRLNGLSWVPCTCVCVSCGMKPFLSQPPGDTILFSGLTDCYGIIADLCTELNLLSKAGEYYDLYLTQMDKDAELGAETML